MSVQGSSLRGSRSPAWHRRWAGKPFAGGKEKTPKQINPFSAHLSASAAPWCRRQDLSPPKGKRNTAFLTRRPSLRHPLNSHSPTQEEAEWRGSSPISSFRGRAVDGFWGHSRPRSQSPSPEGFSPFPPGPQLKGRLDLNRSLPTPTPSQTAPEQRPLRAPSAIGAKPSEGAPRAQRGVSSKFTFGQMF